MRILVACEFSGTVRDAFIRKGHDAISCDLIPSEKPGPHIKDDVLEVLKNEQFDLMIAHPPCTYLAISGNRWYANSALRARAIEFVRALWNAPVDRIAIENPKSVISTQLRPPHQIIQPYNFGHPETKGTCLWLKNLPKLQGTKIMASKQPVTLYASPSYYRSKERSRTYPGIAEAMANQWG